MSSNPTTSDRVSLVTGASGCVGSVVVRRRLDRGESVIGVDLLPAAVSSSRYEHLELDLSRPAALDQIVETVSARRHRLHSFVSSAGVYERRRLEELTYPHIAATMAVNANAFIYLAAALGARYVEPEGHIVAVGSDAYVLGPREGVHYAASKGALVSATYALARALGSIPVMVNIVVPGVIDSPQAQLNEARRRKFEQAIPLGRVASAGEVADTIDALVGGAFPYCTGQKFAVNGGRTLL